MSNSRRIKRRHSPNLLDLAVAQVLAQCEREGCACSPCVEPPKRDDDRWKVRHDHSCPILGPDHAHESCPECEAERLAGEQP